MNLPSYIVSRPPLTLDHATHAACDALLAECLARPGRDLTERLPARPWQFCCYLTDTHAVLIHKSKHAGITAFTPRRSFDTNPFGDRSAVFAASDGIWPMFFALLDRERHRLSLLHGCFRVSAAD